MRRINIVSIIAGVADADRITLATFDRHRQGTSTHRDLDNVLDVAHVDPVASRLLAVDLDLDVTFAGDLVGEDIRRASVSVRRTPAISWLTR